MGGGETKSGGVYMPHHLEGHGGEKSAGMEQITEKIKKALLSHIIQKSLEVLPLKAREGLNKSREFFIRVAERASIKGLRNFDETLASIGGASYIEGNPDKAEAELIELTLSILEGEGDFRIGRRGQKVSRTTATRARQQDPKSLIMSPEFIDYLAGQMLDGREYAQRQVASGKPIGAVTGFARDAVANALDIAQQTGDMGFLESGHPVDHAYDQPPEFLKV